MNKIPVGTSVKRSPWLRSWWSRRFSAASLSVADSIVICTCCLRRFLGVFSKVSKTFLKLLPLKRPPGLFTKRDRRIANRGGGYWWRPQDNEDRWSQVPRSSFHRPNFVLKIASTGKCCPSPGHQDALKYFKSIQHFDRLLNPSDFLILHSASYPGCCGYLTWDDDSYQMMMIITRYHTSSSYHSDEHRYTKLGRGYDDGDALGMTMQTRELCDLVVVGYDDDDDDDVDDDDCDNNYDNSKRGMGRVVNGCNTICLWLEMIMIERLNVLALMMLLKLFLFMMMTTMMLKIKYGDLWLVSIR